MITVDAGRRAARLEELMQAVERHSDPADRELLRSSPSSTTRSRTRWRSACPWTP
jgi:hypothetical protein